MTQSVVGLGRLEQLEVLDPVTKQTHIMRMTGRWLVWDPRRRAFYLTTGRDHRVERRMPAAIHSAHRRFHQSPPRNAYRVNVADRPVGRATSLGLVKSLVYTVPKRLQSPGKNKYRWHHAFGDTGHQGGDHYPQRVMPELVRDSRGDLFIKRRPGNIFTVDTWLRG